jgi:hypothetical protein
MQRPEESGCIQTTGEAMAWVPADRLVSLKKVRIHGYVRNACIKSF